MFEGCFCRALLPETSGYKRDNFPEPPSIIKSFAKYSAKARSLLANPLVGWDMGDIPGSCQLGIALSLSNNPQIAFH